MSYCLTPVKMVIIKSTNHKRWRGCGQKGPSYTLVGMRSGTATMENSMQVPWKWKLLIRLFATPWIIQYMEFSRPDFGVSSHPLPGDLPNPGIERRSPALQVDSVPAELPGKPRILEWVACPFSRRSSQPRNRTGVSCIADGFFTSWAIREALKKLKEVP